MKNIISIFILVFILVIFMNIPEMNAQCPMCRMTAESNLQHGGSAGKGLNTGILYILSIPYLLVASLGFIWYKNRKKQDFEEDDLI